MVIVVVLPSTIEIAYSRPPDTSRTYSPAATCRITTAPFPSLIPDREQSRLPLRGTSLAQDAELLPLLRMTAVPPREREMVVSGPGTVTGTPQTFAYSPFSTIAL